MRSKSRFWVLSFLFLAAQPVIYGCESDDLGDAVEDAGDKVEDAADEVKDKLD